MRIIPELVAYPYPLGFDTIHYYIPAVAHFDESWPIISGQFPVYVYLLHLINLSTGLNPSNTVIALAVGMFGIFAVSIFLVGKKILKLTAVESAFVSVFVIIQISVLRTSWELHRDMFALSTLLLTYVLIYNRDQSKVSWQTIAIAMVLSAVTVSSDGMIGALFMLTLIIYSVIAKTKIVILCTIVAVAFFPVIISSNYNMMHDFLDHNLTQLDLTKENDNKYYIESKKIYEPINLLILFIAINGLLIPTGVIGLYKSLMKEDKPLLLTFPLLISFLLSFSWILFPENETLVADRWIIVAAIFLSIFAGYGIIRMIKGTKRTSTSKIIVTSASILGMFLIIGMGFATAPYDEPFILFDVIQNHTKSQWTATMQPDKKSYDKLFSAISWLNDNTEHNSTILGERSWRGFMELNLEDGRKWEDFGLLQVTPAKFFEVLNKVEKHSENTYVIIQERNFPRETSSEHEFTSIYSDGKLIIFETGQSAIH